MIIIYFFGGVERNVFSGIFKKLTVYFDLFPKKLYLFVSDSSDSGVLYSAELHSADSSVPDN